MSQANGGPDRTSRRPAGSRFPTSYVAPEAQYFLAVSKYKASHESSDLLGGWKLLQARFPDSTWRVKQSFAEDG